MGLGVDIHEGKIKEKNWNGKIAIYQTQADS